MFRGRRAPATRAPRSFRLCRTASITPAPPPWRRGPCSAMQDTKSARDLPSDPAWRDFVPRPSLNMTTVVRPFAPLLAREAAFAWLGGVSARPQVIQEDSDTQMSVACSDSECEQTCCTTPHSASQLNSQAGCDRIEAHSPVVNATSDVARIAAAHVVPVLVAGLEHESNTNAALEALQALGHKWQQRAHANSQSQPLLSCTHTRGSRNLGASGASAPIHSYRTSALWPGQVLHTLSLSFR